MFKCCEQQLVMLALDLHRKVDSCGNCVLRSLQYWPKMTDFVQRIAACLSSVCTKVPLPCILQPLPLWWPYLPPNPTENFSSPTSLWRVPHFLGGYLFFCRKNCFMYIAFNKGFRSDHVLHPPANFGGA